MEFCFTPLREQDIEALTPIMRRAFDEDTRLHLGLPAGGPQGYDDGSFLRRYGLHPGACLLYTSCRICAPMSIPMELAKA